MSKGVYTQKVRSVAAFLLSCVLVFCLSTIPTGSAFATTALEVDDVADEFQQQIEHSASEFDAATKTLADLEVSIEENLAQIKEIEEKIPQQEKKSNEAIKALYIMQQESYSLMDMILSADNFYDLLASLEYIERVQKNNVNEIIYLKTLKSELEEQKEELDQQREQAEAEKILAEKSLDEAQAARQAAQEQALAEAQAQAAASEQAAHQNNQAANTSGGNAPPLSIPDSGVDWSKDKQSFVDEWTPRIDAYLAGSPLSGQGRTFAEAGWNYGVDPRWSPAISCTESSKGAICFLPHNAWGWGMISWPNWEVAIDAHVSGLARGYGHTISVAAAKKYCPPNWEHWYSTTLSQMNMI